MDADATTSSSDSPAYGSDFFKHRLAHYIDLYDPRLAASRDAWTETAIRLAKIDVEREIRRIRRQIQASAIRDLEAIPDPKDEIQRKLEADDATTRLDALLSLLHPDEAEILRLRWLAECTFSTIATILGCTPRQAVHRHKKAIGRFQL